MRKIKEVLRLKFEAGLSHERIAAAVGVSKGAVTKYVQRALAAGLSWPLAPELDDAVLEALLFPHSPALVAAYAPPDYALIHLELKRNGVTLQLLWEEYSTAHPGAAYHFSQFCLHYHRLRESLKRSMRQVHRAGDKLFIDYSGATVPIIAVETGEIRVAYQLASASSKRTTAAPETPPAASVRVWLPEYQPPGDRLTAPRIASRR